MTGSAFAKYLQVQAARNVSCRKKEMIVRRLGGGFGRGRGSGVSSDSESADDGKRFCDPIARGTLCRGWLRRINIFR